MKLRLICALSVAIIPFSGLRTALLRAFPGYRIGKGVRIAPGVVICVDRFTCGDGVKIGRMSRFIGPMTVDIGARTYIGRLNLFECGDVAARPDKAYMGYTRTLIIGTECLFSDQHFFDVYGTVSIGDGSWIAGRGSQFWTHGASVQDRDITIGKRCYVGAMTGFAPGGAIADDVVVAMGCIVAGPVEASNAVIGGVPARVIRQRGADDHLVFQRWDLQDSHAAEQVGGS